MSGKADPYQERQPLTDTIRPEDQVLVALEDGKTFLIRVRVGQKHSTHKGAMEHDDVIAA